MNNTKAKRRFDLINRLQSLGFTYDEAGALRRIEMTLHRWSEHECNGNIQREGEEGDGKPRWFSNYAIEHDSSPKGYRIADREAGALRRLEKIVQARNSRAVPHAFDNGKLLPDKSEPDFVQPYYQSDPRGCALYICRKSDLNGSGIESNYTRGIAVSD